MGLAKRATDELAEYIGPLPEGSDEDLEEDRWEALRAGNGADARAASARKFVVAAELRAAGRTPGRHS